MTGSANAYTHIHPASEKDRETVHDIIQIIRNGGKQDSGAVVLNKIKESWTPISCVTLPFDKKSILAEWVVTPDADSSAVVIYLHGRRFQYDEPVEVYAALIS